MSRRDKLILRAVGAALAVAAIMTAPPWTRAWLASTPRWLLRRGAIAALASALALHAALAVAAPIVGVLAIARIRSLRRRGRPATSAARVLLVCVATLFGLAVAEGGAAWWWSRVHGLPPLPTRFSDDGDGGRPGSRPRPLRILAVGESSALGEPYEQWLSPGHILAWQLAKAQPGRGAEVQLVARGGASLDLIYPDLVGVTRRPDVVLVFSGHNEYQAHYPWGRTVPYYRDGPAEGLGPASLRALARVSWMGRMVREAIDRQMLDAPPPPQIIRAAINPPCCTREESDDRLDQYRRRLDAIAAWCKAIGAVPIFVVPASNDGGFEPNRSVLPAATPREEREAVARSLKAARGREASDPESATAAYRDLVARYPGFAEAHYRLARMCERSRSWSEARRHAALARDLDAMPQRCRTPFQEAVRRAARAHGAIAVDGPEVLAAESPHGLLDDHLFHDAHHPTLAGYAALARDALRQIRERRLLDWPDATPAPAVDPAECAAFFRVGRAELADVCRKSAVWYQREALIRHDPAERSAKAARDFDAWRRLLAGEDAEAIPIVSVILRPRDELPRVD